MPGSQADEIDWENLSNKELHDKFQQMMTEQVQDVLNNFEEAMEKITGFEKTFETKLDNKFNELLARLPPPPPAAPNAPLQQQQQRLPPRREADLRRASRVPLAFGQTVGAAVDTSVAPAADAEEDDYVGDYEDEVDQNQHYVQPPAPPPAGRPQVYIRNGRPAPPPQVRDDVHIPKLKLNIPPFEGRYVPDIYLTWELETEQRFTCLQYPEERRVAAAVCAFTSFACVWWSEHCRLYPIPTTWAALKTAMRTRWVPPYYQRELLQKLQRLRQGKNSVEEYYQELQTGMIQCGIVEENEAMLARFMGGLNRVIQTILEYKEYTNITRLFHLACKAEREVQDRQALGRTNEDMTTLDMTKNIAYMHICQVISSANYSIIYLCYPEQKYFTHFCVLSNCRCMGHLYNPHMKIGEKEMFICCPKSSLTSLLAQEKIESKSLTFWIQIRTAQTYLTQNAHKFFIRTPNWVILFLLETRFRAFSNPIGITFKFVRSVELWTKQSDAAAESESNYKSKGVTSPPVGPIGLVRPRFSLRLPWDVLPPPWPPPLAPI